MSKKKSNNEHQAEKQKEMIYRFQFSPGEMEVILNGLYELPAKMSLPTIGKIQTEGQNQEREFQALSKKPVPEKSEPSGSLVKNPVPKTRRRRTKPTPAPPKKDK